MTATDVADILGPDLGRIRYARNLSGWKVYAGGDLLGHIEQRRVEVNQRTGRKANRWFLVPAAWGWTQRQQSAPPEAMTGTEIGPHPGSGRPDAARLLVDHLHRHGCPAVAHLYAPEAPRA